jgi:hypothetical protein
MTIREAKIIVEKYGYTIREARSAQSIFRAEAGQQYAKELRAEERSRKAYSNEERIAQGKLKEAPAKVVNRKTNPLPSGRGSGCKRVQRNAD